MRTIAPRVVLASRASEWEMLLARHATAGQARFFLERRGGDPDELITRHRRQLEALSTVELAVPSSWRRTRITRSQFAGFLFEPSDVVVAVGQDGLVPNLAKYLNGQTLLGVNPDPDRYEGSLVRFAPSEVAAALPASLHHVEERTMVEAVLDDGQRLVALNEVYVGHESHQSARYLLRCPSGEERQSSSGLVVTTGTGAGGWARSIARERRSEAALPAPTDDKLAFFVREAWPSVATGTRLTAGILGVRERISVVSEMEHGGVAFGDGIELDRLTVEWGQRIEIGIAAELLRLATP